MTEEAISVCPKCHGRTRRLITGGAGLLFKGSGFYITDYRSAGYKADQKRDTSIASSTTSEKTSKPLTSSGTAGKPATNKT